MMKSEFESLAGRNVTDEQYKAIETLYMQSCRKVLSLHWTGTVAILRHI